MNEPESAPAGVVVPTTQGAAQDVLPPPPSANANETVSLADVKQLGLIPAIASLSYVFWICGGMEMIERLAYYGVKATAMLYATDSTPHGGLGVTPTMYGVVTGVWAWVQSLVPAFTGGLSDRYGYKQTIFASTLVKISGYLTMALFPTYGGFFAGAMLLATGTAIFKPGIQGTLVNATRRENSSMAWGIFYQTVNIGGWIGPAVAVYMRHLAWRNVFFTCAGIICINFVFLLMYQEPRKAERLARLAAEKSAAAERAGRRKPGEHDRDGGRGLAASDADTGAPINGLLQLMIDSWHELRKPHVWSYLLIFSGFWFMFNSIFDVLPLHIADWVDTRDVLQSLFGGQVHNPVAKFLLGANDAGTEIDPAGMLNLDAGLIMATCFLFAWLSGKMRATTSMVVGTLISSGAMLLCGASVVGMVTAAAILIFAVGEMLSSPKFSEYIGNIAPSDKKAMYLGFSQIPLAVGWTLEGFLAPVLYDHYGSRERFARDMLAARGMPAGELAAVRQGEAFTTLVTYTHDTPEHLREILRASHHVGSVWLLMAGVGVVTAVGIYLYGRWIARIASQPRAV